MNPTKEHIMRLCVISFLFALLLAPVHLSAQFKSTAIKYGYWNLPTSHSDYLKSNISDWRLAHGFEPSNVAELNTLLVYVPSWHADIPEALAKYTGLPTVVLHNVDDESLIVTHSIVYQGYEKFTHIVFLNGSLFEERGVHCQQEILMEILEKRDWAQSKPSPLRSMDCKH